MGIVIFFSHLHLPHGRHWRALALLWAACFLLVWFMIDNIDMFSFKSLNHFNACIPKQHFTFKWCLVSFLICKPTFASTKNTLSAFWHIWLQNDLCICNGVTLTHSHLVYLHTVPFTHPDTRAHTQMQTRAPDCQNSSWHSHVHAHALLTQEHGKSLAQVDFCLLELLTTAGGCLDINRLWKRILQLFVLGATCFSWQKKIYEKIRLRKIGMKVCEFFFFFWQQKNQ